MVAVRVLIVSPAAQKEARSPPAPAAEVVAFVAAVPVVFDALVVSELHAAVDTTERRSRPQAMRWGGRMGTVMVEVLSSGIIGP